jgi:hypothetical protein
LIEMYLAGVSIRRQHRKIVGPFAQAVNSNRLKRTMRYTPKTLEEEMSRRLLCNAGRG